MAAAVVDYSKWELLAEEEERPAPAYQQARERHQESISIIAHAIRLASPQIKSSELRRLLEFISAQHRGVHETNVKRAAEICAFFDSLSLSEQPDIVKLLLLVRALRKQFEGADEAERRRSLLVLDVAMGALNTLAAVREIGKPQWLFDILHQEPNGAVMQKYKDLGYALDELSKPSDVYSDDLPIDMKSWCVRLWKGVALQLLLCLVMMSFAFVIMHFFGPDWDELGFPAEKSELNSKVVHQQDGLEHTSEEL